MLRILLKSSSFIEVFFSSKDFIILIWGLISLAPNLFISPRGVGGNKGKLTLLVMDRKGQTRKKSVTLTRTYEPLALNLRVPLQSE